MHLNISFLSSIRNLIYHNSYEDEGKKTKKIVYTPLSLDTVLLLYSLSLGAMIH